MKSLRLLLAIVAAFPIVCFGQGALNPPGAPSPSMKTLAQIEPRTPINGVPFTISMPGAYYFTTNLTGVSGTNGITVTVQDVSLDLNGFALIGVAGAGAGITGTTAAVNFTLRNGSIRNWPAAGVNSAATDATFEGLNVYSNGGAFGLSAGAHATVRQCTVSQNTAGIVLGQGAVVADCLVRNNAGDGISAGESLQVMDCTVYGNSGNGLNLANASQVEGCIIKTNGLNGVLGQANLSVQRCNISQNGSNGLTLTLGGRVADCLISSNRVDGIRVTARCAIVGNSCDYNGVTNRDAGIRLLSTDNRVDGNDLTSNITGILSDLGYNLIVRNKATLNATNYNFHPNDIVGPVSANPAADSSWANFAY